MALIVSLVTSFISFFAGQAAMSGSGVSASLFHSVTIPANALVKSPVHAPAPFGRKIFCTERVGRTPR